MRNDHDRRQTLAPGAIFLFCDGSVRFISETSQTNPNLVPGCSRNAYAATTGWPTASISGKRKSAGAIQEESLPQDYTEVLDWKRATRIIGLAKRVAVLRCACRHKAEHLGHACNAPQDVCLALGLAAETLIRNGTARAVDRLAGLRILERAKEAGLVQTAENIRRGGGLPLQLLPLLLRDDGRHPAVRDPHGDCHEQLVRPGRRRCCLQRLRGL